MKVKIILLICIIIIILPVKVFAIETNVYYVGGDSSYQFLDIEVTEDLKMITVECTNTYNDNRRYFLHQITDNNATYHQAWNYVLYLNSRTHNYPCGYLEKGTHMYEKRYDECNDNEYEENENNLTDKRIYIYFNLSNYNEGTNIGDLEVVVHNPNGLAYYYTYDDILLTDITNRICTRYAMVEVKTYDSQIIAECRNYSIDIEHFSETLVRDNTLLHNIFYGEHGWDEAWRYALTFRAFDENGKRVPGVFTPVPGKSFGFEEYSLFQWPPRQYVILSDLTDEEYLQTFKVMGLQHPLTGFFNAGDTEPFTNLYFCAEGEIEGRANQYLHAFFIPAVNENNSQENYYYKGTNFVIDLDDIRTTTQESVYYNDWESPYHTYQYTYKYTHNVNCSDSDLQFYPEDFKNYDWSDWRIWYNTYGGDVPVIDLDDRTRIDDVLTDMTDSFAELKELLLDKAPFGYIAAVFTELQRFTDVMDTDDLTMTIETSQLLIFEDDIEIDFTESKFHDLFTWIRRFSGWVLYSMLGIFFFSEYKKLMNGGAE